MGPDGWFRVLPVGVFARFGRQVNVTPAVVREMAAHFGRVPETGVPVTREHDDAAGRIGDVAALEARPDGLWARIQWTLEGVRLLAEGAFRYLSPEVVWGPTDYDGRVVHNVLTGLSLVNRPFFGRPVSLFWLRPQKQSGRFDQGQKKEDTYMDDTLQNAARSQATQKPKPPLAQPSPGLLGRLAAWLVARLTAWLWPQTGEALARLKELDVLEAQRALMQQIEALESTGLGPGWRDRLAKVAAAEPAIADDIAAQFRALLTQRAQAALFNEIGSSGHQAAGPVERFNAAVKANMHAYGLDYASAGKKVAAEQPDLYGEYQGAVTNRL
jgi:hypothetical protein